MKQIKKFLALSLCCAILILAAGCKTTYTVYTNIPDGGFKILDNSFKNFCFIPGLNSNEIQPTVSDTSNYTSKRWTFYAMTSDAEVVVADDFTSEEAQKTFSTFTTAISIELYAVEKAISATVTGSDIYNFNNAPAGEKLRISETTYEVLSIAKSVYDLTGGYYNPALYYNILAYGFAGGERPLKASELPKDEIIEKYTDLASHFGELTLEKDEENFFVTKPDYTVEVEGEQLTMKLDLGGIGKGYAVDRIDMLFDKYGYEYGLFSFGSSSMLVKSNVKQGNYNLLLTNPRSPSRNQYIQIPFRNEKISTSGDSEQYYIIDGVRYCHIISSKTGKPVQTGIMTATIVGGSAAENDALTTAIMAMEKDYAINFVQEKLTDRKVVFAGEN